MAFRKNKKRIDPRYFLHETTYRDGEEARPAAVSPDEAGKCPAGYTLGYSDYCEKEGANPLEIDSEISRLKGTQTGGYGGD